MYILFLCWNMHMCIGLLDHPFDTHSACSGVGHEQLQNRPDTGYFCVNKRDLKW